MLIAILYNLLYCNIFYRELKFYKNLNHGNRKKLRTLRAERGFTQEKMADLLSIPQASYSNLENNKGRIDLKTIQKIAEIYEMDVIDLLKEEGLSFNQKNKKGDNNGLVIN